MSIIPNRVSAEIDPTVARQVLDHIAAIEAVLPFLVSLSPEQRRNIVNGGDGSKEFIRKALALGPQLFDHLPRSLDLDEMRKDINLADQLYPIKMALIQLSEKLSDTYTVASSEAYSAALTVYNSAKRIKGLEGQSQAIADLGRRFERNGSTGAEPEPTAEPAAELPGSTGSTGSV